MDLRRAPRQAPVDPAALVCGALNPVLEPRGFAAGQVGSSGHEVGVTFCANAVALRRRFGALVGWDGDQEPDEWACSDVVVRVGFEADGTAYLDEVRLDGLGLDRLLRRVDRDDLAPEGAGLDRPRDMARAMGVGPAVTAPGAEVPAAHDLASLGAAGPLGRLPLDRAVSRAAELLDVVLTEAERHPVWWDHEDPWAAG